MRWLLLALSLLGFVLPTHQAQAQSSGVVVQVCGTLPLAYRPGAQGVISLDVNGNTCIAGTFSATGGTISNGTDGQATTSTNQGAVAYNYGFNGATWDRLQVDASKFLKVNCAAGCAGGTASNATSGQATSATNGQTVAWLYGFNGATWDQLSSLTVGSKHALTTAIVDGSGNQITSFGVSGTVSNATSAVATSSTNIGAVSWLYGFNGTTWDQVQVDASKNLKVNCTTGCAAGTISNGASGVATSATNTGTVAYNYGFNGTTWDQLQVDASKNLKVLEANSASILTAVQAPIPAGTNIIGKVGIDQTTPGTTNGVVINTGTNTIGSVNAASQYPVTAVPFTASATGTTAATTATLTGAASVTTYICGFSIRANATAAVTGNSTVTGTISGTLNFTQWTAPAASGLGVTEMIFTPCVPASATNTSIAVVSAAPGTGGVVSVTAWGYKL